jgi:hypothetical protein
MDEAGKKISSVLFGMQRNKNAVILDRRKGEGSQGN